MRKKNRRDEKKLFPYVDHLIKINHILEEYIAPRGIPSKKKPPRGMTSTIEKCSTK